MAAPSHEESRVPDRLFDLISMFFHELKQAEACERYLADARETGDFELESFFQDCQRSSDALVRRAKALLHERLESASSQRHLDDARVEEDSRESFPASDAPGTY
jgi:hypothetical protein